MTRHVARVTKVLHQVQKIGGIIDGEFRALADMPAPSRVEIVPEEPGGTFMMYRYTDSNELCGDTWHQTLEDAFHQAGYEYGLRAEDFQRVDQ